MSVLETRKTPVSEELRIYGTVAEPNPVSVFGNGEVIMRIDQGMKVTLSEKLDVSAVSALPLDALLMLKAVIEKAIETK